MPGLNLEAGGRYTRDEVGSDYSVAPIAGYIPVGAPIPPNGYHDRFSNDDFSYRTSLQYFWTPDVMTYVSFARGYKGPAFAGTNAALRRIKPEIVHSVEGGIKASFLNRRLTTNLTIFQSKFDNFQTQVWDPVTKIAFLTNAGGQRTQGAELEVRAQPMRNLTLSGSLAYTDAKFTDYASVCYVGQTAATGCINGLYQAAGVPLALVAKWSGATAVNYTQPLGSDLVADVNASLFYKGSTLSSTDPNTRMPGYAIVNLNLGIAPSDGRWRVGLFARNLFDKYYVAKVSQRFDGYLNTPAAEARRTMGVQLSFNLN